MSWQPPCPCPATSLFPTPIGDHIQGLPFFIPLFVPGNRVTIHGPPDPLNMTGIESVLTRQMAYPHFPVREAELKADIAYETLSDGQEIDLGFARVSTLLMNHPAMTFGFRVECDGVTLFFTGDHEPFSNIYAPGEADFDDYERVIKARQADMTAALRGVDVLVADAQYTDEGVRGAPGVGPFHLRPGVVHGAGRGHRPGVSDPPRHRADRRPVGCRQ